jgi:ligand-binding SRPBCC domain-containing protein
MKVFNCHFEMILPRRREEIFTFFSDARNLQHITPEWLNFNVLTPEPIEMKAGALIDYQLRVHGIPLRWRTEIRVWEPPNRFVDVQLHGPYRLWHHEHTFEECAAGTLCRDIVQYAPLGGWLVNWLFVHRDVQKIFQHRQKKTNRTACLNERYNSSRKIASDFIVDI